VGVCFQPLFILVQRFYLISVSGDFPYNYEYEAAAKSKQPFSWCELKKHGIRMRKFRRSQFFFDRE